jgi:hypothetical protein
MTHARRTFVVVLDLSAPSSGWNIVSENDLRDAAKRRPRSGSYDSITTRVERARRHDRDEQIC